MFVVADNFRHFPCTVALSLHSAQFAREEIMPAAAHHDQTGEYPWEILKKAHGLGYVLFAKYFDASKVVTSGF